MEALVTSYAKTLQISIWIKNIHNGNGHTRAPMMGNEHVAFNPILTTYQIDPEPLQKCKKNVAI